MLALALFEDGTYYICRDTDVIQKGEKCSVRYKDRKRYAGQIVARSDNREELVALLTKLEEENDSDCDDAEISSKGGSDRPSRSVEQSTSILVPNTANDTVIAKPGDDRAIPNEVLQKVVTSQDKDEEIASEEVSKSYGCKEDESNRKKDDEKRCHLEDETAKVHLKEIVRIKSETEEKCLSNDNKSNCTTPKKKPAIVSSQIIQPLIIKRLNDVSKCNDDIKTILPKTSCPANSHNSEPPSSEPNGITEHSSTSKSTCDLNSVPMDLSTLTICNEDIDTALNNDISWDWVAFKLNVYDEIPVGARGEVNDASRDCLLQKPPSENDFKDPCTSAKIPESDPHKGTALSDNDHAEDNEDNSSSASSYVPESNYSDDSIEEETETPAEATPTVVQLKNTRSCNASTDLDASLQVNKVGHSAPNDSEMIVKVVEDGIKKDWCVYCDTEQGKLSRHVIRKHKTEEEVAKFLSYDIGSQERKQIMEVIRKRGHFRFNTNRAVNTGERKVKRRPNARYGKGATDFATCPSCYGDYSKNSLRHHFRRCANKNSAKSRSILQSSKRVTGRIHHEACDILRKRVFPTMQDDDVAKAIRYDELVILFGNKLCQKYKDPHFFDMIRQKLRHLGRFLLELRKHDSRIHNFFDVFFPRSYDASISAIQSLAGINATGTGYKVPSLATSLGTLIKQIGKLCVSIWIKKQNKEKQTYAEDYLKLLVEDYSTSVARTALETEASNKRQKKVVRPSKDDIQKLQGYLRNKVQQNYAALKENFSRDAWLNLLEVSLISIQLFNRRRAGEIERVLVEDFENYEKIDEKTIGEAYTKFTQEEKEAAEKYVRFTIRGKLGRTVPVLLHNEILACLQLILQHRRQAQVNKKNPYLFGIPGVLKGDYKYLRACQLMRKFAEKCGAKEPSTLRGTILRKHVATMCVNFNLTDGKVSDLANFLGHADKIHREHYRQPIITREILRISKLLETVQGIDDSGEESDNDIQQQDNLTTSEQVSQADLSANLNKSKGISSSLRSDASDDDAFEESAMKKQKRKRSTSPFEKCSRVRWTAKEIEVATTAFQNYFSPGKKLPGFNDIEKVVAANPGVFKRNIATIKTWISNQRKKNARL